MKNTYYFSHDTNANRDEKILSMRVDYGWEGYGWYWAIVETMAEASNYKLKIKNGVPNRVAIAGLSLCHNIPIDKLEVFIDNCIKKYGLFDTDEEYFWSRTLLKRLSIRDEKTSKLRDAGLKGAEKRWGSDSHPNGEANNHPNGNKRKLKEIKVNKIKEKKEYNDTVFLTDIEYNKLIDKFGENIAKDKIEALSLYIKSLGKENKYKDHYATILTWDRNDIKKGVNRSGKNNQNNRDGEEKPNKYSHLEEVY